MEQQADQEIQRTSLSASVSSFAAFWSQCLKYSSTEAWWAAVSFFNMALKPPSALDEFLCMALLKAASREWSSRSRFVGAIVEIVECAKVEVEEVELS
jgi:hypothetical protein